MSKQVLAYQIVAGDFGHGNYRHCRIHVRPMAQRDALKDLECHAGTSSMSDYYYKRLQAVKQATGAAKYLVDGHRNDDDVEVAWQADRENGRHKWYACRLEYHPGADSHRLAGRIIRKLTENCRDRPFDGFYATPRDVLCALHGLGAVHVEYLEPVHDFITIDRPDLQAMGIEPAEETESAVA